MVQGHVYTVLGTVVEGNIMKLKVRNPWGSEQYVGPYSDSVNDGTFFTDIDTYMSEFDGTYIHTDT